jgi:hypothetical protein
MTGYGVRYCRGAPKLSRFARGPKILLVPFLIMLRQDLEAALIVGIVASYLRQTGRAAWMPAVWGGVAARRWSASSPSAS